LPELYKSDKEHRIKFLPKRYEQKNDNKNPDALLVKDCIAEKLRFTMAAIKQPMPLVLMINPAASAAAPVALVLFVGKLFLYDVCDCRIFCGKSLLKLTIVHIVKNIVCL
jgi:hypothetical protein